MISTKDFRRGRRLSIDGDPYIVLEFQHSKVARGGATVRTKIKNLVTGSISEKTFNAGETFKEPDVQDRRMQYLYENGGEYTFMDSQDFEQYAMQADALGDQRYYLKENEEYQVTLYRGNPLSVDLPASVVLQITESEPAVKGDSVSNLTKPATLETGATIKVPLFIKEGEFVKVDTRNGEYLERVNPSR
ncbi:MAG: elongation factor P [Candidatus Zixiibacteriota bacterium]